MERGLDTTCLPIVELGFKAEAGLVVVAARSLLEHGLDTTGLSVVELGFKATGTLLERGLDAAGLSVVELGFRAGAGRAVVVAGYSTEPRVITSREEPGLFIEVEAEPL